jgi:outer membrane protein with beta-barrel domain
MKLKALMLGLALAVLAAGRVSAQNFDLGVEAGANFSNFIGSAVSQLGNTANNSKLGFVGGGYLCLNFGNSFGIRPEVLYEQKGAAISGTSTTTELDYIEIPVLLKFGLGTPGFNPSILLGPSFAWNTLAKDANGNSINNINSSDVGLVGGVEVDISKFLISGRYELGLDNVQSNTNIQNGTLTFLIGYNFM